MVDNIFANVARREMGGPPKPGVIIWIVAVVALIVVVFSSSYIIETGNVGVKKTLGTVSLEEVTPGFHLRLPVVTSVREF